MVNENEMEEKKDKKLALLDYSVALILGLATVLGA